MLAPTILNLPADACRIELAPGTVIFFDGRLAALNDITWVEMEPHQVSPAGKLLPASTGGRWRRAISPFNRKFLFWVAISDKPGEGAKPMHLSSWPHY
jgi:hypothetical protein